MRRAAYLSTAILVSFLTAVGAQSVAGFVGWLASLPLCFAIGYAANEACSNDP